MKRQRELDKRASLEEAARPHPKPKLVFDKASGKLVEAR
jgi:hypothetical protein